MASSNDHDENPWGDQQSQQGQQPGPYQNRTSHHDPYTAYQQQPSRAPHDPPSAQYLDQDTSSPWNQELGHSHPQSHHHHHHHHQPASDRPQQQQQQHQAAHPQTIEAPPGLPPRRTATEMALPTGQDRTHQIEVMQSYEAAGKKDEDDANVEILQREFPGLDGSLIAAIYGDSKSLSATREMLQALG